MKHEGGVEVVVSVKVPLRVRRALRALKNALEMSEGRPYTQAQIVAELVEREAERHVGERGDRGR